MDEKHPPAEVKKPTLDTFIEDMRNKIEAEQTVPMLLWCPGCGERHIDEGEFQSKPHHTHACQLCGMVWRPAKINTCGVQFLPGFKNQEKSDGE